jgi:hypothetical protein
VARRAIPAEFVIGAYHELFEIERSFGMAASGLQARPIYPRKKDSIEAHLTIVFAALAVSPGSSTIPAGQSSSSTGIQVRTNPSRM